VFWLLSLMRHVILFRCCKYRLFGLVEKATYLELRYSRLQEREKYHHRCEFKSIFTYRRR
jgi:hypothetical protein